MRRNYVLGLTAAFVGMSLAGAWIVRPSVTPQPLIARQPEAPAPAGLPLNQVVLFSSGVGYFQREGDIEGDTRVDLTFPIGDVNDLLKSLVIQDTGKGKVGVVTYEGRDPVDKTLRSFAIDLTGNPTFGQLLNQARGEKVEVVMQQTAASQPGTLSGTVMGMESEMQAGPQGNREVHLLNLLCAEGVRSVNLREVQRVRFLNAKMEGELRKALDVLAASHDALKKQVSLNLKGEGKRKVRVGYVAENPVWKTSYRLSVDGAKTQLQGWAAVENVTDEDWNDVRVVLVSGRPISYQMDLHSPLFVPRPVVEPESFASLRPPAYGGALTRDAMNDMLAKSTQGGAQNPQQQQFGVAGGIGGIGGFGGFPASGGNGQWAGGVVGAGQIGGNLNRYQNTPRFNMNRGDSEDDVSLVPADGNAARYRYNEMLARRKKQRERMQEQKDQARNEGEKIAALDPHGKLLSEAAAEEVGGSVRYVIEDRISLPRQKAALLPLLDKELEAKRVCIFNESVHAKFPVLGLRVKNTTGKLLTQGPITVYEDGGYAGDAQLPDIQTNEERLVSYAIDLATEIKSEASSSTGPAVLLSLVGNKLDARFTTRESRKYTIANRSPHERLVIVEHPLREGWTLAGGQKPRETTRDMYRFDVLVPAGKTLEFEVAEEQQRGEQFAGRAGTGKDISEEAMFVTRLDLNARVTTAAATPELIKARVAKGEFLLTTAWRQDYAYHVVNSSAEFARDVTLRHRVVPEWRILVDDPKATVRSKDYPLKLAPGKDGHVKVAMERELETKTSAASIATAELEKMLAHKQGVSDEVKAIVKRVLGQRLAGDNLRAQAAAIELRLKEIGEEQDRLRKNLGSLPPTSAAHKRYLEKFDKQETEIEGLQVDLKKLKEAENVKQKELMELLPTLNAK